MVISIAATVENAHQIDGIQALKAGWNIYMKTEVDCAVLLLVGINLTGRHMTLIPYRCENNDSVKIIIKDLPLHEVLNQDVLSSVKEHLDILSDVKYSNVYVDGKQMHLRNGDWFLYIAPDQIEKVPTTLQCQAFVACIIKPVKFQSCHRCGHVGYKALSPDCPGLALEEVRQMIQPFRGGQCELSNLHVCPVLGKWIGMSLNQARKNSNTGN